MKISDCFWLVPLALGVLSLTAIVKRQQRLGKRDNLSGPLVALTSFFVVCTLVELYFCFLFARSEGFGFTLAAKNWQSKYWKPINSESLRDFEWTDDRF